MYSCVVFFFFKQKTAYEMRISDWSSDVCSSDLEGAVAEAVVEVDVGGDDVADRPVGGGGDRLAQGEALLVRGAGVDHGDARLADDEADVGDGAAVVRRHFLLQAEADEDAVGDLTEGKRGRGGREDGGRSEEHTSEPQSLM